ncbi:MAG: nucleoside-diphosphate sugar epimerase/dehydratase, partial [Thermodesulfobacteriota bacterium]|nr:nucleoside-diphosphate sugar epimerase/dehydratase [Thermodesulfobacteriota bacterium]
MHRNLIKRTLFNRWSAFLHDLLWIPVSLFFAYLLRFNFDGIPEEHTAALGLLIAISLPVQGGAYWLFGMYRGLWRFASIPDLFRILKAVFFGALCVIVIFSFVTRLAGVPRSVLFLYPLLLTAGLSLPRLLYRWYKDQHFTLRKKEGTRIVIIGAGNAGELLLRDLRNQDEYQPVGFLDDDPVKQGREIHGAPILGSVGDLSQIVEAFSVQEIVIAIPSASQEEMQRIMEYCGASGISVSILPTLRGNENYQVSSSQLRPLTIEDLLGRQPIKLDTEAIQAYLKGKAVLVTGGGGSIGSELCRQVADMNPARLIIFDHGEYNLYAIDHELRQSYPDLSLIVVLGDVKNQERVDWVFRKFTPDVVFHAAAYKHVPMLETNPAEGVSNNVAGTRIIVDAADKYGVERFVQVSTDKAVNPANVMGTTKRIGELYCQNFNDRSDTRFITTRFGNVLGSAGSVVPLFQRQIEDGGPVTVTHPEITRYF